MKSETIQLILNIFQVFSSILVFVGLIIASLQVRAARRDSRANVLLRLIDEWNKPETYAAIIYIHNLRRQWKQSKEEWSVLAEKWVIEHATAEPNAKSAKERKKAEEWKARRVASQVISKMGYMMLNGYIKPEDFFGVVPETRRILAVLDPIEKAISKHFRNYEVPLDEWDQPFDKLVFDSLVKEYQKWFRLQGRTHLHRLARIQ